MSFGKRAERKKSKLRVALSGPAGSGKSLGALRIAKGLGGRIAAIDTERGSLSVYADQFEFYPEDLNPPFNPERYMEKIAEAVKEKFDILIIDSITHEWNGSGGCCEINEELAHAKLRGNTWAAWNITTPRHRKFVDMMLQSPLHIIATMRSKTETAQVDGKNGKKEVIKVGMKTEARDGTDYEFGWMFDCQHDSHLANCTKHRSFPVNIFDRPHVITEETGEKLRDWLDVGVEDPGQELVSEAEKDELIRLGGTKGYSPEEVIAKVRAAIGGWDCVRRTAYDEIMARIAKAPNKGGSGASS